MRSTSWCFTFRNQIKSNLLKQKDQDGHYNTATAAHDAYNTAKTAQMVLHTIIK